MNARLCGAVSADIELCARELKGPENIEYVSVVSVLEYWFESLEENKTLFTSSPHSNCHHLCLCPNIYFISVFRIKAEHRLMACIYN